jgi:hypothetical protein
MKNLITFLTLTVFMIFFAGCYTQLGTVKSEGNETEETYSYDRNEDNNYDSDTTYTEGGTTVNNYFYDGNNWQPRSYWMFDYYYPSYYWPSTAFGFAYNDPWFYDSYWHYDPWICGTPFVYYPAYYPPYYGSPYYQNYWWADNYYVTNTGTVKHTKRDFGGSRDRDLRPGTTEVDRTDRTFNPGRTDLPTSVGISGSGGRTPSGKATGVQNTTRGTTSSRGVAPRGVDRTRRGESTGTGSRRERYNGGERSSTSVPARPNNSGGSTRTYTPPPSSPAPSSPPPSSPPPQRGSSRDGGSSGSGSRDGSSRGGR